MTAVSLPPPADHADTRVVISCSHCGEELSLDALTAALADAVRSTLDAAPVPDGRTPPLPSGDRGAALKPRQWEVAQLVNDGWRPPAIAARLGISVHTVRKHLQAIYSTLGVHSQTDLVTWFRTGEAPAEPRLRAVGSHATLDRESTVE